MKPLFIQSIPYHAKSETLFEKIQDLPWSLFIDSQYPFCKQGTVDIITAQPYIMIWTLNGQTYLKMHQETRIVTEDPFTLLKRLLPQQHVENTTYPFVGGAIGYFSYDLGKNLHQITSVPKKNHQYADLMVGIYDWAMIVNHEDKTSVLISAQLDNSTTSTLTEILKKIAAHNVPTQVKPFKLTSPFSSNMSFEDYRFAFNKIKQYIVNGDCYQVNFSQCFQATFEGSLWHAYRYLREHHPSPFSAYLNFPDLQILSFSPEQFLQIKNNAVITKPIKGTRSRHPDKMQDQQLAASLKNSEKDRAENLMIVDLLRNDLGKSCKIGSIAVPKLFELESFTNVHHLVSTITGELAANKTCLDLFRDAFPGGSITGTPKKRAMEIIDELEPHARGIYCGSIGYISYDGQMNTNIAIRTLVAHHQQIQCAAGGALVIDSNLEDEYQETLIKINNIMRLLNKLTGHLKL